MAIIIFAERMIDILEIIPDNNTYEQYEREKERRRKYIEKLERQIDKKINELEEGENK